MSLATNALTTKDAVKDHLGIPLAVTKHDNIIEQIVNGCSGVVETYLNQRLGRRTVTELYDGDGLNDRLYLKSAPIVSVTEVLLGGATFGTDSYKLYNENGYLKSLNGPWPLGDQNISVEYYGGYVLPQNDDPGTLDRDLPHDIELAVLKMVGAIWNQRQSEGVSNSNSGGMSVSFTKALTVDIKAMLKPYRWINV